MWEGIRSTGACVTEPASMPSASSPQVFGRVVQWVSGEVAVHLFVSWGFIENQDEREEERNMEKYQENGKREEHRSRNGSNMEAYGENQVRK